MFCAISGNIPKEPVVAASTGLVYEKSLIENALRIEEKCPVTRTPLKSEELIAVRASKVTPTQRLDHSSTVAAQLDALNDAWQSHMYENFLLRSQVDELRKELAHSLYTCDAACRKVAVLLKERDDMYQQLAIYRGVSTQQPHRIEGAVSVPPPPPIVPVPTQDTTTNSSSKKRRTSSSGSAMEVVEAEEEKATATAPSVASPTLQPHHIQELNDVCKSLSAQRKLKTKQLKDLPESSVIATKEVMMHYQEVSSHVALPTAGGSATAGGGGEVTCMKLVAGGGNGSDYYTVSAVRGGQNDVNKKGKKAAAAAVSAGCDIVIASLASNSIHCRLSGHTADITSLAMMTNVDTGAMVLPGGIYSGSADKTIRGWMPSTTGAAGLLPAASYGESWCYTGHTSTVTSLSIHPSRHYLLSTSLDDSWHILDASSGTCITKHSGGGAANGGYTCGALHPDGLIFAVGTGSSAGSGTQGGLLKIFDIREQKLVSACSDHFALFPAHKKQQLVDNSLLSICFSENGYLAATGDNQGNVSIWDLRKLICAKVMDVGRGAVHALAFDPTGAYLAIGGGGETGNDLQIKAVKEWETLLHVPQVHTKEMTSVAWMVKQGEGLVTSSLDKTIKTLGTVKGRK